MPLPQEQYMQLIGGVNSAYSTIYTSSKIKIGDTLKISGTTSNNGIYLVTGIVNTLNTSEAIGTTFTDSTCDLTSGDATVRHDVNNKIVAGLSVAGSNIQSGSYVASVTNSSTFEMNKTATGNSTNQDITFGDNDVYYTLKGPLVVAESAGGSGAKIEVIRAPGDKLIALGDVNSSLGVDVWSNNATTDYIGTSPGNADGWEESAISPTLDGDNAKFIYYFADEALRVCNSNEQNSALVKWYGYIQKQQFNLTSGITFAEWQEHPNALRPPKLATSFTYAYVNSPASQATNNALTTNEHTEGEITNYYS